MGSTRVGGLVEIAAACMWLWQSQSGMNLEFPPAPIPAGPMPDIASLRPWQILPPGSRPRITLAADANTESSVGWELGYGTSRTDHSLVILRARDVRGEPMLRSRLSATLGLAQQRNSAGSAARPSELSTAELPTSRAAPTGPKCLIGRADACLMPNT